MAASDSLEVDDHRLRIQGQSVPQLGFGTWALHGTAARESVRDALSIGYRHIDTARRYEDESHVGAGIKDSGVPRTEIF